MADEKLATFQDLLNITEPDLQPIVHALQDMILLNHTEANVMVRMGDRAVTYGLGAKKMSEGYCYIIPHKNWINLGFYQGAHLPDPSNLLEGTGKNMRHVKIRNPDEISNPAIDALINEALEERRVALANN